MISCDELHSLVALASIPRLGSIKIRLLIQHFGSASNALEADAADLADLPGFGPQILQEWNYNRKQAQCHAELDALEKYKVNLIPFTSKSYPKKLLEIPDFPVLLYVKGEIKPSDSQSLAIVGTRHPTFYGLEMAEKISEDLASNGYTIVSGLARGIDTAAHRGALKQGRTIAVIGSGLACLYPRENVALAESISENGALISEFSMHTPPDRPNFPQRNRIISGISLAALLIEAPLKSGAMLTTELAMKHRRKLFALPGRADSDHFKGNHLLIKQGVAQLIENAQDMIHSFSDMFSPIKSSPIQKQPAAHALLEKEEEELMAKLPHEELSYEQILQISKFPVAKLNVLLMSLMLKKAIKEYPGKIYKKLC